MAVSTLTSLDKILKDFYQGPIRDQLNNEMLVFELFNKKKVSWTGRKAIMPVRIGRNESAGFRAEDNDLPTADRQKYADLTIQAKYLYGRMDITGPTIEQAKASKAKRPLAADLHGPGRLHIRPGACLAGN